MSGGQFEVLEVKRIYTFVTCEGVISCHPSQWQYISRKCNNGVRRLITAFPLLITQIWFTEVSFPSSSCSPVPTSSRCSCPFKYLYRKHRSYLALSWKVCLPDNTIASHIKGLTMCINVWHDTGYVTIEVTRENVRISRVGFFNFDKM